MLTDQTQSQYTTRNHCCRTVQNPDQRRSRCDFLPLIFTILHLHLLSTNFDINTKVQSVVLSFHQTFRACYFIYDSFLNQCLQYFTMNDQDKTGSSDYILIVHQHVDMQLFIILTHMICGNTKIYYFNIQTCHLTINNCSHY